MCYLSCVLPRNPSESFDSKGTKRAQHCPPTMDELALSEPLQSKDLRIRLKRCRIKLRDLGPDTDHVAGLVLRQVLVQRVEIELQILRRLPEPERVEPTVPHHGPVEPLRRLCAGEPYETVRDRLWGSFLWGFFRAEWPEPEASLESSGAQVWVNETSSEEVGGGGRCNRGGHICGVVGCRDE